MTKLTTKKRNSLKSSEFGLPKEKKYPMPDKSHAINAKARATQMVKKGKLSGEAKEMIDKKANKVLKHAHKIRKHIDKIHDHLAELESMPNRKMKREEIRREKGTEAKK